MMVTRWTPILLLALVACGEPAPVAAPANTPAPAPLAGLAAEAPPSTRVIAGFDASANLVEEFLAAFPDRGCTDLRPLIDRVEMMMGDGWGPVLELRGAIQLTDVACWLGGEVAADGSLDVRGDKMIAIDGALRLTLGAAPPTPTSRPAIAARYAALTAGHSIVVLAHLGPRTAPVIVEMAQAKDHSRVAVTLHDEAVAREVEATLRTIFDAFTQIDAGVITEPLARDGTRVAWAMRDSPLDGLMRDELRGELVEGFRMPTSSMAPTLAVGDHVFALKGALAGTPARGDVVVVDHGGRAYLKRVIGLGGDTVTSDANGLTVNGARLPLAGRVAGVVDDFDDTNGAWERLDVTLATEEHGGRSYQIVVDDDPHSPGTWTVPAGHVFVVGDFRANSADSRHWGAVPLDDVKGVVGLRWYSKGNGPVAWDRMFTIVR